VQFHKLQPGVTVSVTDTVIVLDPAFHHFQDRLATLAEAMKKQHDASEAVRAAMSAAFHTL
jgi:hypothetical protein